MLSFPGLRTREKFGLLRKLGRILEDGGARAMMPSRWMGEKVKDHFQLGLDLLRCGEQPDRRIGLESVNGISSLGSLRNG